MAMYKVVQFIKTLSCSAMGPDQTAAGMRISGDPNLLVLALNLVQEPCRYLDGL